MTVSRSICAAMASGVVALCAADQASAFVSWTNDSGMTDDFMWMNGGSDNGYFGDPTLVGNTFVFSPADFRADSVDGVSELVGDRLEVDLWAKGEFHFTDIIVSEFGDYGVTGTGIVSVSIGLFVTDLDVFRVADGDFFEDFIVPDDDPAAGNWNGSAHADLDGLAASPVWTHIKIVIDNNLSATTAGPGSTSFIQKKVGGVTIEIVPTPGTSALVAMGGLIAFRRKR